MLVQIPYANIKADTGSRCCHVTQTHSASHGPSALFVNWLNSVRRFSDATADERHVIADDVVRMCAFVSAHAWIV